MSVHQKERELASAFTDEALATFRQHLTDDELVTLLRDQRKEVASLAAKRDVVVDAYRKIADTILAPLNQTTDERGAQTIARIMAGLILYNRTHGTVRGSDFLEGDDQVFRGAALYAKVPASTATGLDAAVRTRMRALCP